MEGFKKGVALKNRLSDNEDSFSEYIDTLYGNLNRYGMAGRPIYLTEWNLTVNHRNLINDTCFKSCYLTKNLLENYDRLESFGYWSLTDFLGELQLPPELFHGGLGLFTMNGIPKAHYSTFLLISKLGNQKLGSGRGWFLTRSSRTGSLAILLYNYAHYDQIFSSGEIFDMTPVNRYTAFSNLQNLEVSITLTGLSDQAYTLRETFVNQEHGSSYDAWAAMGAPACLTAEDRQYLTAQAQPGIHITEIAATGGSYTYRQQLTPFEVRLVQISPRSHYA